MLSEQELASGEVNATDDMEGVNNFINSLQNEIMKKHTRCFQLHREKKSQEAIELQEMIREMQAEVDAMMKSQMNYIKFQKAIGQTNGNKNKSLGKLASIKNEKSSNGTIVAEIPKH